MITLTSGELFVNKSVTILGPGANVLAVNGNHAGRVFHFSSVTGSVSGLTITNGYTFGSFPGSGGGGGVYNELSTLTVSNCTVTGNSAGYIGGGICNYGGGVGANLTVVASTISSNLSLSGGGGGGICNYYATMTVLASTLSGNSVNAGYGAGIYNFGQFGSATLSVSNSTFSGNSAQYGGGGIYNFTGPGSATLSVIASTFSGNLGTIGGAIDNDGGASGIATLEIGDTLLSAGAMGGTLYNNLRQQFESDGAASHGQGRRRRRADAQTSPKPTSIRHRPPFLSVLATDALTRG